MFNFNNKKKEIKKIINIYVSAKSQKSLILISLYRKIIRLYNVHGTVSTPNILYKYVNIRQIKDYCTRLL